MEECTRSGPQKGTDTAQLAERRKKKRLPILNWNHQYDSFKRRSDSSIPEISPFLACFRFTTAPFPGLHPHLKPGAAPFPLYLLGFPLMLPPFGGHDSTYARCLDLEGSTSIVRLYR